MQNFDTNISSIFKVLGTCLHLYFVGNIHTEREKNSTPGRKGSKGNRPTTTTNPAIHPPQSQARKENPHRSQ